MSNDPELWLEFGYVYDDGWHEMLWYNEGRPQEITYFMEAIEKRLNDPDKKGVMYYKVRCGRDNEKELLL